MNFEWGECCGTPVVVRRNGDYVRIESKTAGSRIQGTLTKQVLAEDATFRIQIDGTKHSVTLRRNEWYVILLDPPIESGIYVGIGNIYYVSDTEIKGTDASMTTTAEKSSISRRRFAEMVKDGRIRRVAALHGTW
ncbi:hypothetical protein SEA_OLINDD_103 [Microbacterium phage OlinDD]|nr:hypothetical protein SEA_OLINDD_103 [Microbacterium phage OlinDD]AWY05926.1 hypothetical protein SEA_PIONEER3_103 [Microbacterium phage Pioneer3]QAU07432.1 hypothetical protein SEA_ALLEB_100 [Microbacterium phage Alleb]